MWRHIAQSLQGRSHFAEDTPCQDAHAVRVLGKGSYRTLLACVADGAGSAKHSALGSAIACENVIEIGTRYFAACGSFDGLRRDDVLRWCGDIRTRIGDAAAERHCQVRDFATTLCIAIVGPELSFFAQIGDGAIILGNGLLYGVVFWPQMGEYANSTNFITSDEYREQLEFIATHSRCSKIALMTDGIERLALRFECRAPHVPFFDPLFHALESTNSIDSLNDGLRGFLGSDSVHLRTDDDKTLILATRSTDGVA